METKRQERLVILDKQRFNGKPSFPIPILSSRDIIRTPENESKYCHITCLILPILRDGHKILTIDKRPKEKQKGTVVDENILLIDIIGGHLSAGQIPRKELESGMLSLKTAYKQAFRELTEELRMNDKNILPFIPEDLVFLGFYPYKSESNKELSLLFGLYLGHPVNHYTAYDDVVVKDRKKNIKLPINVFSYNELMLMRKEESAATDKYRILDGLGRILDQGRLHEVLKKHTLPVRIKERVDISYSANSTASEISLTCGKLKPFDITFSITDLLRGYTEKDKVYECLDCEFVSGKEREAASHWQHCHGADRKNRFMQLINAGALDFTYTEKRAFYLMAFTDMSYKEIAEEVGVGSAITVNSMRQRFETNYYEKGKIAILLHKLLPTIKRYKKKPYKELMPVLDETTKAVISFTDKQELHGDPENPLPHASVIILVCMRRKDGSWTFLMKDKANKVAAITNSLDNRALLLDSPGGHVEIFDMISDSELIEFKEGKEAEILKRYEGTVLTDEIMKRTALREFNEEVKIRSKKIIPDFTELCEIPYNGPTIPFGWNKEIKTKIYLQVLPQLPESSIRTWDAWEALGRVVKREYTSKFMTWDELETLFDEGDNYMDGMSRVIKKLREEPELKKKMFSLLDKKEKEEEI